MAVRNLVKSFVDRIKSEWLKGRKDFYTLRSTSYDHIYFVPQECVFCTFWLVEIRVNWASGDARVICVNCGETRKKNLSYEQRRSLAYYLDLF